MAPLWPGLRHRLSDFGDQSWLCSVMRISKKWSPRYSGTYPTRTALARSWSAPEVEPRMMT
eukprot:743793-Ditylum_brightwellii.AAC.1